ncbi:hypothetical protein LTR78_003315 [Recurvomyces mirabilis]|uniref:Uncharacterized protein n=1 Tax=Recurvomyces mirabilis TaxID=574656 RepID=A0AAE0WT36_9PEZI|nr:hypothetical protein LTR78_003315 [Recurvomyces mirabilis]KAK5156868.1 hypothetical protein LTS14_004385 [Recurvomyces mirabilis]
MSLLKLRSLLRWLRWPGSAGNRGGRPVSPELESGNATQDNVHPPPSTTIQASPDTPAQDTTAFDWEVISRRISPPDAPPNGPLPHAVGMLPDEPRENAGHGMKQSPEISLTGATRTDPDGLARPHARVNAEERLDTSSPVVDASIIHEPDVSLATHRYIRLTERCLSLRAQAQNEQDALRRMHEFLMESVGKLVELVSSPDHDGTRGDATTKAWAQYRDDVALLEATNARLAALQSKLGALEYRLVNMRSGFVQAYHIVQSQLPSTLFADDSSQSSKHQSVRSTTPTLLRKYYDRRGDEGIYHDRLMELDDYYHDGRTTREMLRDQGHQLDLTDEEFDAQYKEQYSNIMVQLESAKTDADELAVECGAADITIPSATARPPSFAATSSELGPADTDGLVSSFVPGDFLNSSPGGQSLSTSPEDHPQVQRWLSHMRHQ